MTSNMAKKSMAAQMSTNNTEVYVPPHLAPGAIGGSWSNFLICLTVMSSDI